MLTSCDDSSLVVDWLCDQTRGKNTSVGCFYCGVSNNDSDPEAPKQQSVTGMLGSLLKQIISGMERIPEEISRAFREQRKAIGGRRPQLPDVLKMLRLITSLQPAIMCIDALDECTGVQRCKLFDSVNQILEKSPHTRIFLTGRPHIRAQVETSLAQRVASVCISPTKGDITRYLRARLDEDETPDAMDGSLKAEILEKVPENISEMCVGAIMLRIQPYIIRNPLIAVFRFLLDSLYIGPILQESTIYRRRERLNNMSEELELRNIYDATINRIWAQNGDKPRLGLGALMWVSNAERPLSVDELCYALAVDLDSEDFNADNVPSISTVVGSCQGLITVDREASTVGLINFTLQEYLSSHPEIFCVYEIHSTMAETCLSYLNSSQVNTISADTSPDALDTPFLEYSSIYWGVHAQRKLSARATSLALQLFQEYNGHVSAKLLLELVGHLDPQDPDTSFDSSTRFSGLHCACFFGIDEVVAALIETGCYDINEGDLAGYTPLAWAAHNGHDDAVKLLLELKEVLLDEPDHYGNTPLSQAAGNGHEGVVIMLLGRDVNPDKPNSKGQAPLLHAARNGHEGVVEILLWREEVDPDRPDNGGGTPLLYAAGEGYEGVVKILLERGVNPDKPDDGGRTPLSYAAENGHEGVVEMLLGREGVNPDKPDNGGGTPLSYAAWTGQEEVVKVLLGWGGVHPDTLDNGGRTPLSYAAENGHEGVVEILLQREDVYPNYADDDGRTPLMLAEMHGHERVIELLKASLLTDMSGYQEWLLY